MNLYLRSAGVITALGWDAQTTMGSLRSGLTAYHEIPFIGEGGEELLAAPIDGFGEGLVGLDRYQALALHALRPCLASLSGAELAQAVVIVGLPRPDRPGVPGGLAEDLLTRLAEKLGLRREAFRVLSFGRASVLAGLEQAQKLLAEGATACLVGGVDSLVNGVSLEGLSRAGLLKERWDGFIPGEGAGFVWVSARGGPGCFGRAAIPIRGIGVASDPADGSAARPLIGKGYHQAFKKAMADAGLPECEVQLVINDVSGVRTAFEDAAMGAIRFFRSPREDLPVWHVASSLGETGAAAGAVALVWAAAALELGFAPGPGVLLSTADGDQRAAVFLGRPEPEVQDDLGCPIRIGRTVPVLHPPLAPVKASSQQPPGLSIEEEQPYPLALVAQHLAEAGALNDVRLNHHAQSGDPWADIEGFEQRLVAHLDALAWLGSSAREIAMERLMSDEGDEVAAAGMALLSTTPDAQVLTRFQEALADGEDRVRAIGSVLPHMPREAADVVLKLMLESAQPFQVAEAVRALTVAGWVNEAQLVPYLRQAASEMVPALIEAAGASSFGQQYELVLKLAEANADLLSDSEWLALLSLTPPGGLRGILSLENLQKRCPIGLALLAARDGSPFYSVYVEGRPLSPALIDAVGWAGEVSVKGFLLGLLDQDDDPKKVAASRSLHRIFGLSPMETVELPEEEEAPPEGGSEPEEDEEGELVVGTTDEPEEADEDEEDTEPEELAPLKKSTVDRLSTTRADWEKAIAALQIPGPDKARLRHGQPWTRQSPLAHLSRLDEPTPERIIAAWEYVLIHRKPMPFHPYQYVARQKAAMAALATT